MNVTISENKMFESLEKADELYKQYREQQKIINVLINYNSHEADNGYRKINHPLTIEIEKQKITNEQLIFTTDAIEKSMFYGKQSVELYSIWSTAALNAVMPKGNYRVIDDELFKVEDYEE